jgi:hypothetical protein
MQKKFAQQANEVEMPLKNRVILSDYFFIACCAEFEGNA